LSEEPTEDTGEAKWQFVLLQLGMENVNISIRDPSMQLDVRAKLDTLVNGGDIVANEGESLASKEGPETDEVTMPAGDERTAANDGVETYAVGWQAEGRYNEGIISGYGKAGGLLALQEGG